MPLVQRRSSGAPRSPSEQRKARKVKPQYTEASSCESPTRSNQPEAELIEALLLEEGIPSMLGALGLDVPDFLVPGPRDILVPESGAEAAREALPPAHAGEPGARA